MNNAGFIQIHRQLLKWEWYSDVPVRLTFLHLLILANWENKNWKGIEVKRGQLVVGRKKLSKDIGISERQLRTALSKLKATNEITTKATNKYTVVTIVKYDDYQDKKSKTTSKTTSNASNERPTIDQQSTTTKEDNNINKLNNKIKEREAEFKNSLLPFLELYGKEMLNSFYLYWTEKKPKGRKMRFEMEKVFDTSRRLTTWSNKSWNNSQEKPVLQEIKMNVTNPNRK